MPKTVPADMTDLLERPVYVTLATVNEDGSPQLTVVWCGYDGRDVLVNTVRGRKKERNMSARPVASVLATDPENPYRWLAIRGSVELSEEGALEHIEELAHKYFGKSYYGGVAPAELKGQQTRVICRITPTSVVAYRPSR
jgi:PPOX class probable F420-dependent enzyme